MEFKWYKYGEQGIEDAFDIRREVFCKEVGFTEDFEFDDGDKTAHHLVCYDGGVPVCTARLLVEDFNRRIGRLRRPKQCRGKGYGKATMEEVMKKCSRLVVEYATLGAKYDKKGFYEALGFEEYGDIFLEEGIPHIMMKKLVTELLF
ncbi:MAG: GNAT family N-acetyltransferase [Oscillospiraceae bacterium]|nr:GNAT family N-acetyltransferase [Oscillospiraceae bacterium]